MERFRSLANTTCGQPQKSYIAENRKSRRWKDYKHRTVILITCLFYLEWEHVFRIDMMVQNAIQTHIMSVVENHRVCVCEKPFYLKSVYSFVVVIVQQNSCRMALVLCREVEDRFEFHHTLEMIDDPLFLHFICKIGKIIPNSHDFQLA